MRIGVIIPSLLRGGAERVIAILCNEFVEKGDKVFLLLTEDSQRICYGLDKGVEIVDITSKKSRFSGKMLDYIKNIKKIIKKEKIQIVISFITRTNICAILACRQVGVPVIVSERNNPYIVPHSFKLRKIRNLIYRFSNGLVFQTTYAKNYFAKSIAKKSRIIMNPMASMANMQIPFSKKRDIIVTACRLAPQKNVPLLIEAYSKIYKKIPNFKLEIYGEGPERENIEKLIKDKHLSEYVILKGQSDNVIEKLAEAKIFVLSSDFEGLSNALMEALCVGAACIATDSPTYGNRDLIENGKNGFLVPIQNSDLLAEKIITLAQNESMMKSFSENARRLYQKVNSKVIVKEWDQYIENILSM